MKVLKKVLSSLIIFVMCFGFLAVLIPQENLAIEQEIEIVSITEENETDETKYVGEEGTGDQDADDGAGPEGYPHCRAGRTGGQP